MPLSFAKINTLIADSKDVARATTNSLFQMGVGTITYSRVNCIGNESDILNCAHYIRENECNHFQEAGVDCQTCMCNLRGWGRWRQGIEKSNDINLCPPSWCHCGF